MQGIRIILDRFHCMLGLGFNYHTSELIHSGVFVGVQQALTELLGLKCGGFQLET